MPEKFAKLYVLRKEINFSTTSSNLAGQRSVRRGDKVPKRLDADGKS
jgi:hypothetical protein